MSEFNGYAENHGQPRKNISRQSTHLESAPRPVFDPGHVDQDAEDWEPRESLHLSQEQAEHLEATREPGDVKYIMKVIDDPQQYLYWRRKTIDASYVDFKRIHPGNLQERLQLHTGDFDVPSGRSNPQVEREGKTPLEVNLEDLELKIRKGKTVFQVMYYDWSFADEEGGPGGSSFYSRSVEERPEGWIPVSEVSAVKDQTQSAITRAIQQGDLTAVMEKSPGKRWVKPGESLDAWSPGRQTNYLLRRRLNLVKETIHGQLQRPRGTRILSLSETMDRVRRLEIRRFGSDHTPGDYLEFFEDALDHPPKSMVEWVKRAGELVDKYCR
jgi:hypothetical protein